MAIITHNLILPILFWEVWQVILALVIVAGIESAILSIGLAIKGVDFFKASFVMNVCTTFIGYVFQGIARIISLIIGSSLIRGPASTILDYPIVIGMTGNIGLGYHTQPIHVFIINFSTSCSVAFLISAGVEYVVLQKLLKAQSQQKIRKSRLFWTVCLANFVTYSLIFTWLLFNFFIFYRDV